MAANVGTAPVQFFKGASPVSAFLGATAIARTLYFTGDVDGEWTELANWSTGSLPTAGDSVIATASIDSNSGSEPTMVNLTLNGNANLSIDITVTGDATFNGTSTNDGTVTGDATFNGTSINFNTVTGTATFTGSACNDGGTAGTFVPNPPPSC